MSGQQTKVFIGNLSDDITAEDLKLLLSHHGTVLECDKLVNYAFAHFIAPGEADSACKSLDGKVFKGMKLAVKLSRSPVRSNHDGHQNTNGSAENVVKTKVYVGNLSESVTEHDLKCLMEPFGTVTECDKLGNYAFVHFSEAASANKVCQVLNRAHLKGTNITVQLSRSSVRPKAASSSTSAQGPTCFQCGRRGHTNHDCHMASRNSGTTGGAVINPLRTKIHVGNLAEGVTSAELRKLLEKHGTVVECDVLTHYAFAHFSDAPGAQRACQELDKKMFKGTQIRVQMSKSTVRTKPGMGLENMCFHCGDPGHWTKSCPLREPPADIAPAAPVSAPRPKLPIGHGRQAPVQRDPFYAEAVAPPSFPPSAQHTVSAYTDSAFSLIPNSYQAFSHAAPASHASTLFNNSFGNIASPYRNAAGEIGLSPPSNVAMPATSATDGPFYAAREPTAMHFADLSPRRPAAAPGFFPPSTRFSTITSAPAGYYEELYTHSPPRRMLFEDLYMNGGSSFGAAVSNPASTHSYAGAVGSSLGAMDRLPQDLHRSEASLWPHVENVGFN